MNILIDGNVPGAFRAWLKDWGYEAGALADHLALDASDADVLRVAGELGAVLLTADVGFSNVARYPIQDSAGVIILTYRLADEGALAMTLRQALDDLSRDGLRGALVVVTPHRYGIRRPE